MIDRATAEKIKDAADIVEVVSDYVHLTRRGSNYMGLCPFHNERTPSFSVNRRKNMCYCFSCHKGGSPVNFIMEKEGISYHDALLQLAKKYGIEVQERQMTDEERMRQSLREGMLVANEWAMLQMEHNLTETQEGRDIGLQYLSHRGLTPEAIKKFHLGYALDRPTALADAAKSAGYDLEVLKAVGLVGVSQRGNLYDRFRGRVIFPILNPAGKVVAFGGRDLKGGPAKYVNSPESDIYKKNRELYGIHQAKNEIVRQDKCFLVEGYMDVIGMWQSGMENVIASSGTALTDGQIALIHRFTENITLLYDGDAAGIKASLRGIDMLLSHKMKVKVLLLPDGHDPDSFARVNTPEKFREYVKAHETDIIRFKTQVMMQDAADDPLKRSDAIRSVVESLACIPDPITAKVYIQECARLMNVDEETISTETQRMRVKVLERIRSERRHESEKERIDVELRQKEAPDPLPKHERTSDNDIQKKGQEPAAKPESRLYPLERQVVRYCVRYGMMDFCEGVDEGGEAVWLNVAEFIDSEFRADGVAFSSPTFSSALETTLAMKARYKTDAERYKTARQPEYDEKRRKGIDEIAEKALDLNMIAYEEKMLDERIDEEMWNDLRLFSAEYTGRMLASHEDDGIRRLANECINDTPPLSKRFDRLGQNLPEHERLVELLPRAIDELKQGIIRLRIDSLMKEMRDCQQNGDTSRIPEIMQEISHLHHLQSQIAKAIGERVISPIR